jgi:hypothetical protein
MCAHAESTNKTYAHLPKLFVKIGAELNNSGKVYLLFSFMFEI